MDLAGIGMKGTCPEFKLFYFTFHQEFTWAQSTNQLANFVIQALTDPDWSYGDIKHGSTNPTLSRHFNLQRIFPLFPDLYEPCVYFRNQKAKHFTY